MLAVTFATNLSRPLAIDSHPSIRRIASQTRALHCGRASICRSTPRPLVCGSRRRGRVAAHGDANGEVRHRQRSRVAKQQRRSGRRLAQAGQTGLRQAARRVEADLPIEPELAPPWARCQPSRPTRRPLLLRRHRGTLDQAAARRRHQKRARGAIQRLQQRATGAGISAIGVEGRLGACICTGMDLALVAGALVSATSASNTVTRTLASTAGCPPAGRLLRDAGPDRGRRGRACAVAQEHASGRRPFGRLVRDDCDQGLARDHVAALGAEHSRARARGDLFTCGEPRRSTLGRPPMRGLPGSRRDR
jgi:hypothetical protein